MDVGTDEDNTADPAVYDTFLNSRPPKMEYQAIEMLTQLCKQHK